MGSRGSGRHRLGAAGAAPRRSADRAAPAPGADQARRRGRRQQRTRAFRVALAGYTNAGKTSLMNALCRAEPVGARPAVRDARHDHALPHPPRRRRAAQRHGRIHPPPARPAVRQLRVDAGRDRRGVAAAGGGRRLRSRARGAPAPDRDGARPARRRRRSRAGRLQQERPARTRLARPSELARLARATRAPGAEQRTIRTPSTRCARPSWPRRGRGTPFARCSSPTSAASCAARIYAQCRVLRSHATAARHAVPDRRRAPSIVERTRARLPQEERHDAPHRPARGPRPDDRDAGRARRSFASWISAWDASDVAVVGRNGVGKSTLLDVLAGRQRAGARPASCAADVICWCPSTSAGEPDRPAARAPASASGSAWSRRCAARPDLLLLDEPTRGSRTPPTSPGCCAGSREWRGGLLVVSHDRRLLRTFDQFFIVAESGCRHVAGRFDHSARRAGARARGQRAAATSARLNRLVAREEHNAALRRRRQSKKNVGRIRELKRCPARIKLNDKRSYKQESQGKRRGAAGGAHRRGARVGQGGAPRAARSSCRWSWRCRDCPRRPPTPIAISCEAVTAAAGARTLFSGLSLEMRPRAPGRVRARTDRGRRRCWRWRWVWRRPASGQRGVRPRRGSGTSRRTRATGAWTRAWWSCSRRSWRRRRPTRIAQVLHAHRFPLALADRPLATLSPGERVRAALICLTRRRPAPELLVLDEPTQHLDFVGSRPSRPCSPPGPAACWW